MLHEPTLDVLSRNASVINADSEPEPEGLAPPPRRIRTFSGPRSPPRSPASVAARPHPAHLSRELGYEEPPASPSLLNASSRPSGKPSLRDFQFGKTLGEGAYSTVKLATSRADGKQYAVKIMFKVHLTRAGKLKTVGAELKALRRLNGHPGIVAFYHAFQDDSSFYLVIELAAKGEMQSVISRLGSLSTRCTQYYAAQIADALEYMHSKEVIHRDLKPENLLLDDDFRIKIADFGTGKVLENGDQRATTFVGTAQYQAPELLELNETTKSSDYWAFGCIVYQMISGRFAFSSLSDYLTWQKVKKVEYEFPSGFDEQAKGLVQNLLVHDALKRLGAGPPGTPNDPNALKSHAFFAPIVWTSLWTDPAPPLEAGLVKKEHPDPERVWDDIGAAWDELVGSDDDSDEIEWAADAKDHERLNGSFDIGPRDGMKDGPSSPSPHISMLQHSMERFDFRSSR
ncbi:kinase-like domain-containing protein [Mycena alexandri]|uniref:non-specific serine/threonine protein kinase n=1 Tax=Mycena alexandri TaxID=1745969 RepID=A0AAD6S220_9AGAR|nr:kinase-like domain-containing protein [Mycena alexandri]